MVEGFASQWAHVCPALERIRLRMHEAARNAGRAPSAVRLLAVSKTFPPEAIRAAAACGQRDFGENYLQEARTKQQALRDIELVWHFIGPLQSNKTREIAEHFGWVHGVARVKIAERLSAHRPIARPPLNICLQINISGEANKSGIMPTEAASLAARVASLPGLKLRGLMTIPEAGVNPASAFAHMQKLLQALNGQGHQLDTLSMGMSADFEFAIQQGATIIRVGSAIFGNRTYA